MLDPTALDVVEADYVCLGSGAAGLTSAITAAHAGLKTIVIESSGLLGGSTAVSHGQVWVPGNYLQSLLGIDDSPEGGLTYLDALRAGYGSHELARALCFGARDMARFMAERAGIRWSVIRGWPDYYKDVLPEGCEEGRGLEVQPFPAAELGEWRERTRVSPHASTPGLTNQEQAEFGYNGVVDNPLQEKADQLIRQRAKADERCMGPGLAAALTKSALTLGVTILVEVKASQLIQERDRVVALDADVNGRTVRFRARRGILLATGGYDWDADLRDLYDPVFDRGSFNPASVAGDHLKLAIPLGAMVAQAKPYPYAGFEVAGADVDGKPLIEEFRHYLPHAILVNRAGRRFADDAFTPAFTHAVSVIDGRTMSAPNYPLWAVFDEQYAARFWIGRTPPGGDLSTKAATRAETVRDLALAAGISPDGLEDEISKFNQFAQDGADRDFHRGEMPWSRRHGNADNPNPTLGTIERAPFYAIQLKMLADAAGAGLVCNADGQVLTADNRPIEGLYAAGSSMARMDLGAGYQAGQGIARAMTFGYLAASHASNRLARVPQS